MSSEVGRQRQDVALKSTSNSSHRIARPSSLAGDVYESIFAQLMSLEIAPGARITVDGLVKELEVSHTPIREALGRLEGEGLVKRTHLVGYHAAPQISRAQFEDLYEMRRLLEPEAAARAAAKITDAEYEDLCRQAAVMAEDDATDAQLRYSNFARKDAAFHDRILEISGNALIRETLRLQHTHFHIFRLMFHWRVTEEALDEHAEILDALLHRDPAKARDAMTNHIRNSEARLQPAFS